MIELIRTGFRELVRLWEEKKVATYSALMTFLAAYFIMDSGQKEKKLTDWQADQSNKVYILSREKEALRMECQAWRDSAFRVAARYSTHLEQDLIRFDTSRQR